MIRSPVVTRAAAATLAVTLSVVPAASGCGPRRAPIADLWGGGEPAGGMVRAGFVSDGVYQDARWGFSLPVPAGWSVETGLDSGALRVTLTDPVRGTRVEIWAFQQLGAEPRPRSDCRWTFVDTGRYRVAGRSGETTTATCTPDDPDAPRVYAWLVPAEGYGIQAELHVPVHALVDGRRDGEALVRRLSL